jgi:hypothetical protein
VSVSLGTDSNGRHRVDAGAISVRTDDEATARRMAAYALKEGR